jgi:nucleotide-binding universal stress UspA family protein
MRLQRLVVAYDFSPTAERALEYALMLAARFEASVLVVYAFVVPPIGFSEAGLIGADQIPRVMKSAENALVTLSETHRAKGARVDAILRHGDPVEQIHAAAAEYHADMIVMGTHGHRGVARVLLGSVAEDVLRTSKTPVLIVRGD